LLHVRLHTIPSVESDSSCDPFFRISGAPPHNILLYDYEKAVQGNVTNFRKEHKNVDMPVGTVGEGTEFPRCILFGDVFFEFLDYNNIASHKKLFHFWINTALMQMHNTGGVGKTCSVTLLKSELDGSPRTDKNHKTYSADFKVELFFAPVDL
jgi:hypothetical protein